ncbi:MAG: hypothetical protein IT348_05750 [Candidatus Eisenbacteria bacterium]|nr:hypothetical protein [Candidatus Eisenbacteria bacterium]
MPTTVPALAFNRHAFVFATRSLPPPLTCARVGDRLVFSPDVFGATDAQRLRAYVVMAEAEKAALDASWRGRTFMRPSA